MFMDFEFDNNMDGIVYNEVVKLEIDLWLWFDEFINEIVYELDFFVVNFF